MNPKYIQRLLSACVAAIVIATAFVVAPYVHAETPIPNKARIVAPESVISTVENQRLSQLSERLEKETGAVLVAVIIDGLNNESIESYVTRLHDAWRPGLPNDGRGSILVISLADRKVFIAPTRAMGVTYTDARTASVIAAMKPDLKKMEYSNAVATYLTNSAAFAGKAEPSVAPVAELNSGYPALPIFLGTVGLLILGAGILAVRSNLRETRKLAERKARHELQVRETRERMERDRIAHEERTAKLNNAPDRIGYTKRLVGDEVVYEKIHNPFSVSEFSQSRNNEEARNRVARDVARERAAALGVAVGLGAASASKIESDRQREAIAQRARDAEAAERKRRQRERDEEESIQRRRRRDDEDRSSYYSPSFGSNSSSPSSSDFASSSGSGYDGGGSGSDY